MKTNFLLKIGAGFLTGSVLALVPASTAQASDLYDSLKEFSYSQPGGRYGEYGQSGQYGQYGNKDVYDSREPTAAGPQGPMRDDMYKDYTNYGAPSAHWDDMRMHLGPVGGEGTN